MKSISIKKVLPIIFAISFMAGCSSTDTKGEGGTDEGGSASTAPAEGTGEMTTEGGAGSETLGQVVYFEFDQAVILPEGRALLNAHAEKIKANGGAKVVLEGHADERGTREYNLALGERRAQAVQSYLAIQGVSNGQLETVSYGEEKPVAEGSMETSWSQNRRVELRY
jgi:peptidoglycan-associated lipoprotein